MPESSTSRFPCPRLRTDVELTAERERHITNGHPDLLLTHRARFAEVVAVPDVIRRSTRSATPRLFSRWYSDIRRGRHVVVVEREATPERYWVVTAYIARRLAAREDQMAAKLAVQYDRDADILYLVTGPHIRNKKPKNSATTSLRGSIPRQATSRVWRSSSPTPSRSISAYTGSLIWSSDFSERCQWPLHRTTCTAEQHKDVNEASRAAQRPLCGTQERSTEVTLDALR